MTVPASFVKIRINLQRFASEMRIQGGSGMLKQSRIKIPLCVVLSLLMLVDYAIFAPSPVQALDKKSVLIGAGVGAAAGAGIVLAAPAIAGAVGAAGGLAGIGTAIVGGLAAAGGAIVGSVGAVVGAIGAGIGMIGGWIAGIIASPLFIPALLIIGAAAIGYYLYRRHKKKQAEAGGEVIPDAEEIMVTPGDYDMNPVMNPMDPDEPIDVGDAAVIEISGDEVAISDAPPASVAVTDEANPLPSPTTTTVTTPASADAVKAAHDRYIAAYQKYTSLVTTGGSGDVQGALKEYQSAYREYIDLKAAAGQ